jgi:hypothetical protein
MEATQGEWFSCVVNVDFRVQIAYSADVEAVIQEYE